MRRLDYLLKIEGAFEVTPIVAILGPRQCGKTTLAREFVSTQQQVFDENYFDLEDPDDLMRLENPKLMLSGLHGLITLDEIQRLPEIFPLLRVLVDKKLDQKYLILGSASRELIQQSSESLAGRISYVELTPFSLSEVENEKRLWLRGGFPLSYLAKNETLSYAWRKEYVRTYLEQDVQMMGIQVSPDKLRRFWMMLLHYHANIFNASEIGRSLNMSHVTAKNYLDILSHTFMIRELKPWFENISKRQIKSSKIYFRDSGIMHALMGVKTEADLLVNPKLGASWEGFALEEITRHLQANPSDCYFWATQGNAELDLLIVREGKRLGFEFKFSDLPKMTKSMHCALEDLNLDELVVIYPGDKTYRPHEKVQVCGLKEYLSRDI